MKLEVTDGEIIGWIYYHWTWNCGERFSYNVFISPEYKIDGYREYIYFSAFDSTADLGHYNETGVYGGTECFFSWHGNASEGSHWWFRVPIIKQSYKLYTK